MKERRSILGLKEEHFMAETIRGNFRSVTGQELEKRLWPAEGQPKAVVQFVHGMAEHIDQIGRAHV